MNTIRVFVAGKINLSLNILGTAGGLHLLDSVMASVDLGDFVSVTLRADKNINIRFVDGVDKREQTADCSVGGDDTAKSELSQGASSPDCLSDSFDDLSDSLRKNTCVDTTNSFVGLCDIDPENNTVKKTVDFVRGQTYDFGADIVVEKHIPVAAGLGGSSADIAAVLYALDLLLNLKNRGFDIMQAAKQLGSDVPFMLAGGCARVSGTGDVVAPIANNLPLFAVVASGNKGVSSGQAYRRFDTLTPSLALRPTDNDILVSLLHSGDKKAIDLFGNALTDAAESLCGGISAVSVLLTKAGARRAIMTGSGSAVVGFFSDFEAATKAAYSISKQGFYAKACRTVTKGVVVIDRKKSIP